jgi:gas vesicle protein
MSERDDFGAFLIGFIIGGLTGAAVSLLLAPQSGEETRAMIKDRAIELKTQVSETAEETYARAEEAAAEARARADELAKELGERGKIVLEDARTKSKEARDRGKGAVESIRKPKKDEGEAPAA